MAIPTPSTNTPVAIGSKVPAWPTFFVSNFFLTFATTSWLVIPPALSTNRKPSINSPFSRAFYMDLQQLVLRPHVISLTLHQPYAFVQLNHSLQKQIHPYHLKRIQVMV